ncbi:unnamed protein product [Calicophoron daubneyi]|uniref:CUB domain-containing protein n=1 Tax=Calicophoron daubneyi TaxID=300641 RepID=A0AAV2TDF3_CALDB
MVEPGNSINLDIKFMNMRANSSGERSRCIDRLEYHDGVNGSNPTKGWYCGGGTRSIQSSSNTMTLMFRSYGNSDHTGFRAYFTKTKQVDPTAFGGCGGNVHLSPNSVFGSPLKGGLYPPNQLCVWTLHAKLQLRAMIQYLIFDMNDQKNCCMSHVSVYDGMYGDSKRLARNCTLGNVKDYVVMGSSESLTVVFYTTNGLQRMGISVFAQGSLKKN